MNNSDRSLQSEGGYATGQVRLLLRVEGLAILIVSTTLFFWFGGHLWIFTALFFAPDLSLLGYVAGQKVGAALYNAVHSYALPSLLTVIGILANLEILWQVPLIFLAHAAFDRSLGYGLKYAAGFRHTHLGPIGKGSWPKTGSA